MHYREEDCDVYAMSASENFFSQFAPLSSRHSNYSSSFLLTGGFVWLSGLHHQGATPHTVGGMLGHANSSRLGG
jgi:hypothetical protein